MTISWMTKENLGRGLGQFWFLIQQVSPPLHTDRNDYRGLLSMRQDNSNLPGCEVLCLHKKYIMTPPQSLETLLQYVALSSIFNPWQYPGLTVNPVYTRQFEPTLRAMTHIPVGLKMKYNKIILNNRMNVILTGIIWLGTEGASPLGLNAHLSPRELRGHCPCSKFSPW